MALDLKSLEKPQLKAPQITLVGLPGAGKTSLGNGFPKPVFMQAEEISGIFDDLPVEERPDIMPLLPRARLNAQNELVSTKAAALDQLRALATQEHDYKTLVIDSITSLHALFEHELCIEWGVTNVAEAAEGYGKGFLQIKEMHGEIKAACDHLRNRKGMTIVFLAHAGIVKMKNNPDAAEYTVYGLDMHKESAPIYTNLVDAVLYLRQEAFVKGAETDNKGRQTKMGKVAMTGKRILVTAGDGKIGYMNAKNRYHLEAEIFVPIGENPLLDLVPFFNGGVVKKPAPKAPEAKPETAHPPARKGRAAKVADPSATAEDYTSAAAQVDAIAAEEHAQYQATITTTGS